MSNIGLTDLKFFRETQDPLSLENTPPLVQESIAAVVEKAMLAYLIRYSSKIKKKLGNSITVTVLFESQGVKVSSGKKSFVDHEAAAQAQLVLAQINAIIKNPELAEKKVVNLTKELENAYQKARKEQEEEVRTKIETETAPLHKKIATFDIERSAWEKQSDKWNAIFKDNQIEIQTLKKGLESANKQLELLQKQLVELLKFLFQKDTQIASLEKINQELRESLVLTPQSEKSKTPLK